MISVQSSHGCHTHSILKRICHEPKIELRLLILPAGCSGWAEAGGGVTVPVPFFRLRGLTPCWGWCVGLCTWPTSASETASPTSCTPWRGKSSTCSLVITPGVQVLFKSSPGMLRASADYSQAPGSSLSTEKTGRYLHLLETSPDICTDCFGFYLEL